jgi:DNA mismatch repair protein MutL
MIHQLSEDVINKIAAGEVIERPANAVKELVENSLDAGADIILVEVREGGKGLIKVSDNGAGMNAEDAQLAVQRHTTSKITKADDLFAINSFGFRGEALASIAAISSMDVISRTKEDLAGIKLEINNGKIISRNEIGCNPGTVVEIRELFFNTPARQKYLKSIESELAAIVDVITRYALANPQISFKLLHNGKVLLNTPKTFDSLSNVANIYGRNTAKNMVAVNHVKNNIEVMGFVSKPEFTKSDKSYQSIFVNGRYVKNKVITGAIYDGYTTMLMERRHPVVVLDVKIEPKLIDVNVHPAKSEIRVSKEAEVYEAVSESVNVTLFKQKSDKMVPEFEEKDIKKPYLIKEDSFRRKYEVDSAAQTLLEPESEKSKPVLIKPIEIDAKLPPMTVKGQIHKTFILAETKSGLLILDQHAVEERVNYELFMKQTKKEKSQPLLSPDLLELNAKEYLLVQDNIYVFEEIGFKLEEFGGSSFRVREIPVILGKVYSKEFLMDILNDASKAGKVTQQLIENKIATKSCRASIKAGDELTMPQMNDLLKKLAVCNNPFNCPHGRPTIINMTLYELEKKFKRIV